MGILIRALMSALVVSLVLSACTVGPDYVKPKMLIPKKFKENKGFNKGKEWKNMRPQENLDRGTWWKIFNDPQLNYLEAQLNKCNQNIVVAEANYRQSMAIIDEARSNYFPIVSSYVSVFRQKIGGGATSFISTSGGTTTAGTANTAVVSSKAPTSTAYTAGMTATWEPDIWGLVRRTVEADIATAQSNAALIASTRLSAQGSLAQYYFELRTLDSDQKFLDDTVVAYKKILQLTRNQYASGVASRSDVVQAQSQVEVAKAQALNNGILRGQYEHAIAVLIGRPPAFLNLKWKALNPYVPVIPVSVPSAWLERRPDVAQQERLIQTASATIGVAVAAYFPNITLTGIGSAAGKSLHKLIHTPSLGWSAGTQLTEIIFDGGLRAATVRAAWAAYGAQVATYRQAVLTAFQDVEDNLIALRILKQQSIVQNKAAADAEFALKLVLNQYRAGTVDYASVLTSQIAAFTARKNAIDVAGLKMTSAVALIKSLGGGWDRKYICPPMKNKTCD